ncbi:hypothetical protein AAMO2058_000709800 [Amorphochlora amoebiformis]
MCAFLSVIFCLSRRSFGVSRIRGLGLKNRLKQIANLGVFTSLCVRDDATSVRSAPPTRHPCSLPDIQTLLEMPHTKLPTRDQGSERSGWLGGVLDLGMEEGGDEKILVVGDGDFSYSLAMTKSLRPTNLIATSYDSLEELKEKYPNSSNILISLSDRGVCLMHGVDARNLESHFTDSKFDRIVFMFPQHPPSNRSKNKIQLHRTLLEEFLLSARNVLTDKGRVFLTLLEGQGGTTIENAPRGYQNSWYTNEAAAKAGLMIADVHKVDSKTLYEFGYVSRGYKDSKKGFLLNIPQKAKWKKKQRQKEGWTHVLMRPDGKTRAIDSPLNCFDNSFWITKDFCEKKLFNYFKEMKESKGYLKGIKLFDYYTDEDSGNFAVGFRFSYTNSYYPVSREAAWDINGKVRDRIESTFASKLGLR